MFSFSCLSPFCVFSRAVAQNRKTLHKLGITHVLNAAHSKQGSIGDQSFYGNTCVYYGISAEDSDHFDLSQYFKPAADFIHKALKSKDGTVYECVIHCPIKTVIVSYIFSTFILLYRKSAGALHHGNESISHSGLGVPDAAAASHPERCSEARHQKTSHLPQPELPVSPPQAGWAAYIQTEDLSSSLTSLFLSFPTSFITLVTLRPLSLFHVLHSSLIRTDNICIIMICCQNVYFVVRGVSLMVEWFLNSIFLFLSFTPGFVIDCVVLIL